VCVCVFARVSWWECRCNLETGRSVPVGSDGTAEWRSEAEGGSVLLFGAETPCHLADTA
jgi:hypothetical protein